MTQLDSTVLITALDHSGAFEASDSLAGTVSSNGTGIVTRDATMYTARGSDGVQYSVRHQVVDTAMVQHLIETPPGQEVEMLLQLHGTESFTFQPAGGDTSTAITCLVAGDLSGKRQGS